VIPDRRSALDREEVAHEAEHEATDGACCIPTAPEPDDYTATEGTDLPALTREADEFARKVAGLARLAGFEYRDLVYDSRRRIILIGPRS
jgi:hypothetical protein